MINKLINKYKNMSIALKSSFWFTISNFLQKGISTLATPIFTRLLTKEEFGFFSLYQSWFDIFLILSTLNLSAGVMINALNKSKNDTEKNQVVFNFQFLEIIITILVFFIVILINSFNDFIFGMPNFIIILLFLQIFLNSGMSLWLTRQKFEFKYIWPLIINLIVSILNVGLSVLFIKNINNKKFALIYGTILSCLLPYLILVFINLYKGKNKFDLNLWKYALKFNLPLLPHYLSLIVLGTSDRIMIERICGLTDTSLYTVAYNIARIINMFCTGLNSALTPWIYKKMNEKKYNDIKKISNIILIFISLLSIFVMILGPEALYILGGNSYIEAKIVIPPVIVGLFFMFLYPLFGNIEFYFEKNIYTMIASVISAILNVILNIIFIPIYGYVAAAYTTLFCYSLLALFHWLAYKFIINNEQIKSIYSNKLIIILSCIIIAFIPIIYMLYAFNILRYIVFISFFILGFILIIIFIKKFKYNYNK